MAWRFATTSRQGIGFGPEHTVPVRDDDDDDDWGPEPRWDDGSNRYGEGWTDPRRMAQGRRPAPGLAAGASHSGASTKRAARPEEPVGEGWPEWEDEEEDDLIEEPRHKAMRSDESASMPGSGLYSFTGSSPDAAAVTGGLGMGAVIWPTFDEEADEGQDDLNPGSASPAPSPGMSPDVQNGDDSRGVPEGPSFEAEVERILAYVGTNNHRGILGLQPEEAGDEQAIQSKYRRIMRLIHPDKRRPEEVAKVGGKERCDEAVTLVQKALADAKKAAKEDPRLRAQHNNSVRLQEIQRQQARQARQQQQMRQSPSPAASASAFSFSPSPSPASSQEDFGDLLTALGQATATTSAPPRMASGGSTTSQITALLANLRRQQ
eukprot:TRINITY_DN20516_c0_g1_i1.p1 TRINITY_DN20516_c0_g1~~TRINITY_DN20516_c0_g1_i1.p1  ORF type:complete len:377 (+),score=75.06 TRINITY_DN20516_c0_g1_i1:70-1200(+)